MLAMAKARLHSPNLVGDVAVSAVLHRQAIDKEVSMIIVMR